MAVLQANKWLIGAVSATLISSAALWEGTRYYAYYDIAGVPTVCMGYTGSGIIFGKKYSQEECSNLLKKELVAHSNGVLNCIKQPLKENEFSAFVLFAYNVGVSAACSSRAFALFNSGNTNSSCRALAYSPSGKPVWSYTNNGTVFVKGLFNRRIYEMKMCLGENSVS
jgi:lysozyme